MKKMHNKGFIIQEAIFSLFLLSIFAVFILGMTDYLNISVNRFKNRLELINLAKIELDNASFTDENAVLVEKYIRKVVSHLGLYKLFLDPDFSNQSICTISSYGEDYDIEKINVGSGIREAFAYRGKVYLARDTASQSDSDFYIFGSDNNKEFEINTGPGLSSLFIKGKTAYLGNTSINSQAQVFDIESKNYINSIKLPLPFEESNSPSTSDIKVFGDSLYISSSKWDGAELLEFDSNNFSLKNTYETNSQINEVLLEGDDLYVAASNIGQLHLYGDSHQVFSPSGYSTQEGKSLYIFGTSTYFGRTVGGFDNVNNHELFLLKDFSLEKSVNIGSGVYGIVRSDNKLFIASGDKNIKILNPYSLDIISNISISDIPNSLSCDLNVLVVGFDGGFYKITFKEL